MKDDLSKAGKRATKTARKLTQAGGIPASMGIVGLLAIMHERIRMAGAARIAPQIYPENIAEIAAFGIAAFALVLEDDEWVDELDNMDKFNVDDMEDEESESEEPLGDEEDDEPIDDKFTVAIKPGQKVADVAAERGE